MYSLPRTRSENQTLAPHGLRKNAIVDPTLLAHILRYLPIASRVMSRVHPSQIAVGPLSRQRHPPRDAPGLQYLPHKPNLKLFAGWVANYTTQLRVVVPIGGELDRIGSVRKCRRIFVIPHDGKSQFREALRRIRQRCFVRFNHANLLSAGQKEAPQEAFRVHHCGPYSLPKHYHIS